MSIIFSKQDALASSIAMRATTRMQKPEVDYQLEQALLKKELSILADVSGWKVWGIYCVYYIRMIWMLCEEILLK